MNSLSVRIFQRVLAGASISTVLRIKRSVIRHFPQGQCKQGTRAMIGKTRQEPLTEWVPTTEVAESFDPALGQPRGVLRRPLPSAGKFLHAPRGAPTHLALLSGHYCV